MTDKTDTSKEREAFEAWYCDQMRAVGYNADDGIANLRESNHYGKGRVMLNGKWEGWQARASLAASAGSEPVALIEHTLGGSIQYRPLADAAYRLPMGVEFKLYTYPSPPEGMVGGWTKASQQLPPCREDQLYIGINTAGFAGVFNAVRVISGNTYCLMEVAEESVSIMSDLDIWKPFIPPTSSADSRKGE